MTNRSVIMLVLLLTACVGNAGARTWYVAKDGVGDYTVIQDAVDHAATGDTIRIGPGRYEEKRPYTSYPSTGDKWTFDVYVAVTVSDLTIIGSGAGLTIIGPPARIWQDPAEPKIICALSRVSRLVVEDLSLENVYNGVYRGERGTLTMRRCESRGCQYGVTSWSEQSTLLESCRFQDLDDGVLSFSPARNVTVRLCEFVTCRASFDRTSNAIITDCQFIGYTTGSQHANGSTGGVYNSRFTGQTNVGIVVASGSTVDVGGNTVNGSAVNLRVRTLCTVTGEGNVFGGGSVATISVSNSDVRLHGNHILHGEGTSVYLETFLNPPLRVLDLTNNYWGTASADTIASWIYDGHDNPAIYGEVLYEPFSAGVIPTKTKSLGGVKRMYR